MLEEGEAEEEAASSYLGGLLLPAARGPDSGGSSPARIGRSVHPTVAAPLEEGPLRPLMPCRLHNRLIEVLPLEPLKHQKMDTFSFSTAMIPSAHHAMFD